jgi:hypothetical protein
VGFWEGGGGYSGRCGMRSKVSHWPSSREVMSVVLDSMGMKGEHSRDSEKCLC